MTEICFCIKLFRSLQYSFFKNILSQTTRRFGKFRKDFNWIKQNSDRKSPPSNPYFDPWSMFSYFHICSFISAKCSVLPRLSWWISSEVMYVLLWSNVFYLRLLWCKSLFQVVTKCANNYHLLINMFPLQTPTNKIPVCE